jgi:hypothetical protein
MRGQLPGFAPPSILSTRSQKTIPNNQNPKNRGCPGKKLKNSAPKTAVEKKWLGLAAKKNGSKKNWAVFFGFEKKKNSLWEKKIRRLLGFFPNQKLKNKKTVYVVNTWRCFSWLEKKEQQPKQPKRERDAKLFGPS